MNAGLIEYGDIKDKPFKLVLNEVLKSSKLNYGNLNVMDLQLRKLPAIKIHQKWEHEVFGFGVYIFFDDKVPVYAGKADSNFKHRFQSHRYFDGRLKYAFNELARKTAVNKLGSLDLALKKDSFYGIVIPEVEKFDVVRINLLGSGLSNKKCSRLENLFRKGYYETLYNGMSVVKEYNAEKNLSDLMK
jgi:hypothetical protein